MKKYVGKCLLVFLLVFPGIAWGENGDKFIPE
jgi:hypothetical protein